MDRTVFKIMPDNGAACSALSRAGNMERVNS